MNENVAEHAQQRKPNTRCSNTALLQRKFFYLFTCEYCFIHYLSAFFIIITGYKLLFNDWRGYLISWLAVVWKANQYISIFGRLRLDIKRERVEIEGVQGEAEAMKEGKESVRRAA